MAPAQATKPAPRLSSGILGMKFMQKEDSPQQPDEQQVADEEPQKTSNKFVHDTDPGAWFGPRSQKLKSAAAKVAPKKSETNSVASYADLFEATPQTGRKTFGAKPPAEKAEEMVTKSSKKEAKPKGKKRSSEEGLRLSEGGSAGSRKPASKSKKQRKSL